MPTYFVTPEREIRWATGVKTVAPSAFTTIEEAADHIKEGMPRTIMLQPGFVGDEWYLIVVSPLGVTDPEMSGPICAVLKVEAESADQALEIASQHERW